MCRSMRTSFPGRADRARLLEHCISERIPEEPGVSSESVTTRREEGTLDACQTVTFTSPFFYPNNPNTYPIV